MNKFVGCRKVEVFDKENDISFPMLAVYPTNTASKPVAFGPFTLEVAMDAPVAEGRFPLIMISHGSGGSNLTHRTLGTHLAMNGFVVCMPEHPYFERVQFHHEMNEEVLNFLQKIFEGATHAR